MTLDDLIFSIEAGAEAVPMLKRFKERQQQELVPMLGAMLDNNYGPAAAAIERMADAVGLLREAKAAEQLIDAERSARIKAGEAKREADEELREAAELDVGIDGVMGRKD